MGRYGRQDVIPNVLAEAMATGVPVVGTDVGGVTELIEDGVDGRVVPERDPQALADALEDLWRNPQRARDFGRSGRRKVESIWDRENNLDELCGIINENVVDRVEAGNSSLASGAGDKAEQMMEAEGRAASPITVS